MQTLPISSYLGADPGVAQADLQRAPPLTAVSSTESNLEEPGSWDPLTHWVPSQGHTTHSRCFSCQRVQFSCNLRDNQDLDFCIFLLIPFALVTWQNKQLHVLLCQEHFLCTHTPARHRPGP